MNIDRFLEHYELRENPFGAEEARHDPIFERLIETSARHPDFAKLMGQPDQPSTAVALGEKGSGKTAMRLTIARQIEAHNREHPDRRVLVVPYDDFNPFLDNLLRATGRSPAKALEQVRLEDHQDAMLSLATRRVVDGVLGVNRNGQTPMLLPEEERRLWRRLPRETRVDLAVLAAIYDQPESGPVASRWRALRSALGLGWGSWLGPLGVVSLLLLVTAGVAGGVERLFEGSPEWVPAVMWAALALGAAGGIWWLVRQLKVWLLARSIHRETPMVHRNTGELAQLLADFKGSDLKHRPLPTAGGAGDSRYQLTRRLLEALDQLGYVGMTVLVDRVDEPTVIAGEAERMRALVWPMMDNKFLQQERVGVKLLLPIELRHLLHRESAAFFQEARLDKQSLVDPLMWSGAILYDLCTQRLNACRPGGVQPLALTDLFEEDVNREFVVDALDQMHQPRDAFKFLYSVIQEHCRIVPDDQEHYRIARLTLESVRRDQSQRVQALYRGISPA